jgi:SAM-dependent methyltransferase
MRRPDVLVLGGGGTLGEAWLRALLAGLEVRRPPARRRRGGRLPPGPRASVQRMSLPEHVRRNKASWEQGAAHYVEPAKRDWARQEIRWGMYGVPEADVGALPDVAGMDVVELGCGTAYFSAWLARRGARPTGVDVTEYQLATARAMQAEHGLEFPLIEASAEAVPLPDDSADLVLSEYGASLWCEPDAWIAEAARLLRPGGCLVFLTNHVLVALTSPSSGPVGDRLVRSQREIARMQFDDDDAVEFHLSHGDWIATLGRHGFTVTALHELYAPDHVEDEARFDWMTPEWARRWPLEELWVARAA